MTAPNRSAPAVVASRLQNDSRPAADAQTWRALSYFNLHRVFIATLFTTLMMGPVLRELFEPRDPQLATSIALGYLALAIISLVLRKVRTVSFLVQVCFALCVDITMITLLMHTLGGISSGIGILMVITIGGGALLLPGRLAILFAALASLAVLTQHVYTMLYLDPAATNATQSGLLGVAYFGTAIAGYALARRARESQALAERRGIDLANLAQLNELIIQRMRTGILVIDRDERVRLMNESAWYLMGMPNPAQRDLQKLSPELAERLNDWRKHQRHQPHPVRLAVGVPTVAPRFTALGDDDAERATLVFLEDTTVVSQRAEELNLASLGQLAGSIAHEIRNPLAAISHAGQLLAESEQLTDADKRLLEIVRTHAKRMNTIVENVLQISRRERCRPEPVKLGSWVQDFAEEFREANHVDAGTLSADVQPADIQVLVDTSHLNQVMWNLCQNALRYGHQPDRPPRITIRGGLMNPTGGAVLDIVDEGPGIEPEVAARIFEPFFTSDSRGSGLGLYIARQLCEANQTNLEYIPIPAGGSCFRITFPIPRQALADL